ncbi:hypothetical protein [Prochlorococcus sp. MIT 1307]|uniref:hypothetical protein n=1 Tax=Prochlorococcus sp. MIT 1307 TaxID=3096219 RepID=UPI002A752D0E|nr:hypothetical protein [Prochlorococcus sp. MIT 1307]
MQVIRSTLLATVRNAIISLVTGKDFHNLDLTNIENTKSCQLMIDQLVRKCISMLTIEQIMDLVDQIERENNALIDDAKNQMSKELSSGQLTNIEYEEDILVDGKNVELTSQPPINNPSQIDGWFFSDAYVESNDTASYDNYKLNDKLLDDHHTNNEFTDLPLNNNNWKASIKSAPLDIRKSRLDSLKSLFSMAIQAFDGKESQKLPSKHISSHRPSNNETDKDKVFLLDTPQDLANWTNSFEEGISRRLRNLSHALNIELLRVGILNSILPITILEAVLSGQMSSQDSQTNILRVNVPTNSSGLVEGIDIACILVRLSELEFDNAQLRNLRLQLNQYQKDISQMVRQYRYWQGRSLSYEIHHNWWKDPKDSSATLPPMN